MGTATLDRFQAPARQGHFVVTTELPEIQTVTVWTPCCVPMDTISNKKNWLIKPLYGPFVWGFQNAVGTMSVARCKVTAILSRLVLSPLYIAIYMYNLVLYPAQKVWSEREIFPYFAPSTTRNASDGRLSDRVDDTRCLLIILWHLTVIDWLANQSHNWISVKSLLTFSAIGSHLCVDGKCYRPFDRRFLPPMRSPGTSIGTSPNWLCTCLIDRVKHQPFSWLPASPNKRLSDWLVSQDIRCLAS